MKHYHASRETKPLLTPVPTIATKADTANQCRSKFTAFRGGVKRNSLQTKQKIF